MTGRRRHLATRVYGRDGSYLVCRCGEWNGTAEGSLRAQRLAHRAHRVDQGETVTPLAPTKEERLKAAQQALSRVRALAEEWVAGGETVVEPSDWIRAECGRDLLDELQCGTAVPARTVPRGGPADFGEVSDSHGNAWPRCSETCDIRVVRPGFAACQCEEKEYPL